jgi:hypothetical protein
VRPRRTRKALPLKSAASGCGRKSRRFLAKLDASGF